MIDKLKKYLKEVENFYSENSTEIEAFRISYAGKKGILSSLFSSFRDIPAEQKKNYGKELNKLKEAVSLKVEYLKSKSKGSQKKVK